MNVFDSKIIIVDDHTLSRTLLRIQLGNFGFKDDHIDDCSNAFSALEKMSGKSYDIAIVDWDMPEMSGLELLENYQKSNMNSGATAFIMVSAEAQPERILHALNKGIVSYITKPISQDDINEKMSGLVSWIEKRAK